MEKVFINAINSAISGTALKLNISDSDYKTLYKIAAYHDLTHIVAFALKQNKLLPDSEIGKQFENALFIAVYRYEQLNFELKRVCDALEEAEIPFIPLKGSVLRNYYPQPWMRTSCDIDIYTEKSDLGKACEVFEKQLGFSKGAQGYHDVSFYAKSGVHIELHYDLIEQNRFNKINRVLSGVWNETVSENGKQYHRLMTDEMFYFYHIAHMVKHFKGGGCGVRPFLDLWILNNKLTFDIEKRNRLLEKGGILKFSNSAEKLSEVWFGSQSKTEETTLLAEYTIGGGVYGNVLNKAAITVAAKEEQEILSFKKIWKPYSELKCLYPVLEKHKFLLPIYQIIRWNDIIFGGTMKRKINQKKALEYISDEKADRVKKLYDILKIDD